MGFYTETLFLLSMIHILLKEVFVAMTTGELVQRCHVLLST